MAGWACDRFGRKTTLAIGDVWFTVGAVLIAASYSYPQLVVGRLVLGFGVGTAAMVAPVYIGELAPSHLRGRLVTIQSLMITGGQVISYALVSLSTSLHYTATVLTITLFSLLQGAGRSLFFNTPSSTCADLSFLRVTQASPSREAGERSSRFPSYPLLSRPSSFIGL